MCNWISLLFGGSNSFIFGNTLIHIKILPCLVSIAIIQFPDHVQLAQLASLWFQFLYCCQYASAYQKSFLVLLDMILLDDKNYSQAIGYHISEFGLYQHTELQEFLHSSQSAPSPNHVITLTYILDKSIKIEMIYQQLFVLKNAFY